MNRSFLPVIVLSLSFFFNTWAQGGSTRLPSRCSDAFRSITEITRTPKKAAVETHLHHRARELVRGFHSDIQRLYATSGFKNRNELEKAIQASTPAARRSAQLLKEEDVEFALNAPMSVRDSIQEKGFLNFRKSHHSEGGAAAGRDSIEADYSGIHEATYSKLDTDLLPKFAYLRPKSGSDLQAPIAPGVYGGDRYIFKKENLRERITFTLGDSLNRHYEQTGGRSSPAESWDQRFVPWEYRELLVPAIASEVEKGKLGVPMYTFESSLKEIEKELPPSARKNLILLSENADPKKPSLWANLGANLEPPSGSLSPYRTAWGVSMDYVELQIWGPLHLEDVAAFEFTEKPPQGAFLEKLLKNKVEIRDASKNPPRVWIP